MEQPRVRLTVTPPVDRDRWLQFVRDRAGQLQSGSLGLTRYELADLKVSVHGATAIVTGLNITEGARDGNPFSLKLRFTQTWVRVGKEWRRAAFHDAPVKEWDRCHFSGSRGRARDICFCHDTVA